MLERVLLDGQVLSQLLEFLLSALVVLVPAPPIFLQPHRLTVEQRGGCGEGLRSRRQFHFALLTLCTPLFVGVPPGLRLRRNRGLAYHQPVLTGLQFGLALIEFLMAPFQLFFCGELDDREGSQLLLEVADLLAQFLLAFGELMLSLTLAQPRRAQLVFQLRHAGVQLCFALIDLLLLGAQMARDLAGLLANLLDSVSLGKSRSGGQDLRRRWFWCSQFLGTQRMRSIDASDSGGLSILGLLLGQEPPPAACC